jgi:hypothetical protein
VQEYLTKISEKYPGPNKKGLSCKKYDKIRYKQKHPDRMYPASKKGMGMAEDNLKKWTSYIESALKNPNTVEMILAESLTIQLEEFKRNQDDFRNALTAFQTHLVDYFQTRTSQESDFDFSNFVHETIKLLKLLLPRRESADLIRHNAITDTSYAAVTAYNAYSSDSDLAEIFAAFLLYTYAEIFIRGRFIHLAKETCAIDQTLLLNFLQKLCLESQPFVAPKLEFFQTQSIKSKYLDDGIETMEEQFIVQRFYLACAKRDTRMALKLLGEIRPIVKDKTPYYEALIDFYDEHYEDTLHYLDRLDEKYVHDKDMLNLNLQALAMLGDSRSFFTFLNRHKADFDNYYFIAYCTQLLVRNCKEDLEGIYPKVSRFKAIMSTDDSYYKNVTRRKGYEAMLEGAKILQAYGRQTTIDASMGLRYQDKEALTKLNAIGHFLWLGADIFYVGTNEDAMSYGSTPEVFTLNTLNFIRDKYVGGDGQKAFLAHARLEDQIFAYDALYEVGYYEAFCTQVKYHIDWFEHLSFLPEVQKTLQRAYVESKACNIPIPGLDKLVQSFDEVDFTDSDMTYARMRTILPSDAWTAYQAAEWQYRKSQEEDYGWKDAGMISLAFFRILEMILNSWFIEPLACDRAKALKKLFNDHKKSIDNKADKSAYHFKWNTNLNILLRISNNPDSEGMMLGPIEYLFKSIGSEKDPADPLAQAITDYLQSRLNPEGATQVFQNFAMEDIISQSVRDKYRNPPAHCKYLPYETATEARDYTIDSIERIASWLKPGL